MMCLKVATMAYLMPFAIFQAKLPPQVVIRLTPPLTAEQAVVNDCQEGELECLRKLYKQTAKKYQIDWKVLEAIHQVETGKSNKCKNSSAGAKGPMQFMPSTFRAYSDGDICDLKDSIDAAANYLTANDFQNNPRQALWQYNHSEKYVNLVLQIMSEID